MTKIKAEILALKDLGEREIALFKEWVWRLRHINMFEPKVLAAPRTVMCKAYDEKTGDPLLFMPLQPVLMYDAIASSPDLTPRQEALALARINQQVEEIAKTTGFQEIYFICRDDSVSDICARHGFEEIKNVRVLKKTISFTKEEPVKSTANVEEEVACSLSQS